MPSYGELWGAMKVVAAAITVYGCLSKSLLQLSRSMAVSPSCGCSYHSLWLSIPIAGKTHFEALEEYQGSIP